MCEMNGAADDALISKDNLSALFKHSELTTNCRWGGWSKVVWRPGGSGRWRRCDVCSLNTPLLGAGCAPWRR